MLPEFSIWERNDHFPESPQRKQYIYNCEKDSQDVRHQKRIATKGCVTLPKCRLSLGQIFDVQCVFIQKLILHIFSFRSYWVGSVSWSPGGLFLACVLKRGSLLMFSRLGGLLTLTTSGCSVDFGPAHFLPLHPLITYRFTFETFCSSLTTPCYKLLISVGWCS